MQQQKSLPKLFLAGVILTLLPAASLTRHSLVSMNPIELTLPAKLTRTATSIEILTELNQLNLSDLAGDTNIATGDVIYIHLNTLQDSATPNKHTLRYPYAVSQNRPSRIDDLTVSLRGMVIGRDEQTIFVAYQFETLTGSRRIESALAGTDTGQVNLAVSRRAVAHVSSIKLGKQTFPIR